MERWLGGDIAEAAHQGFEAYLLATPPRPSANDIAESRSKGKHWPAERIIITALAERVRKGTGLADLPDERVLAGLFALRGTGLGIHAGLSDLEQVVEAEIRRRNLLNPAMRQYNEPQLQARLEHVAGLNSLMRDDAYMETAAALALEWLNKFEGQSLGTTRELISRVVHSARAEELRALISRHEATDAPELRRIWDAAGLMVDFKRAAERLSRDHIDPELLWEIRDLASRRAARNRLDFTLGPTQAEWIFSTFRRGWPEASQPAGGWCGDQHPWNASRYLTEILEKLGASHDEQARAVLHQLSTEHQDGYSDRILAIIAEQAKLRAEAAYVPPPTSAIAAVVNDTTPTTIDDLMALMIDEIAIVQAKITSDDVESWRGFFDSEGAPLHEEPCRDHLVGLLRQGCQDIHLEPEAHKAGDKEVDIICRCSNLCLPIEIKGQWHKDLWHAADTQLDRLYAADWQAERRGIYLVLWFGTQSKRNKKITSAGRGKKTPKTPAALRDALLARSSAAQEGRIAVIVLDVTRPQQPHP